MAWWSGPGLTAWGLLPRRWCFFHQHRYQKRQNAGCTPPAWTSPQGWSSVHQKSQWMHLSGPVRKGKERKGKESQHTGWSHHFECTVRHVVRPLSFSESYNKRQSLVTPWSSVGLWELLSSFLNSHRLTQLINVDGRGHIFKFYPWNF